MPDFGDAERCVLSYFTQGTRISFKNRILEIKEAGKPTCPYGEPKTDIYILAADDLGEEEIKISYKKRMQISLKIRQMQKEQNNYLERIGGR